MHHRQPAVALLMTVVFLFGVSAAQAAKDDSNERSEALIREGVELRRLSDDQAALTKFEAAVQIQQSPRAVAQLGLCELAVGKFARAVEHLTIAMHATKDKWVASHKPTLRESLEQAKSRVGRVEVVTEPPGAEISINGEHKGTAPVNNIVVDEGTLDVQVEMPGYLAQTRNLSIKGSQYQKLAFALVLRPTATAPQEPTPHDVTSTEETLQTSPVVDTAPAWLAPTKWAALAGTALGFGLGTYEWIHHQSLVKQFDDAGCQVDRGGNPGFVTTQQSFTPTSDCSSRFDDLESAKSLRLVGFVAGGAFLAGYVTLMVLEPKLHKTSSESNVACAPGIASLTCAGRF